MSKEEDFPNPEALDPVVEDSVVSDLIEVESDRLLAGIVEEVDEYIAPDSEISEEEKVAYRSGEVHAEFLSPEGERLTIARSTGKWGVSTIINTWQLADVGIHGVYTVYKTSELEKYQGATGLLTIAYYYSGELHKGGRQFQPVGVTNDPDLRSALDELGGLKKGGGNTGVHQSEFDKIKHSLEALKPEYRRVLYGTEVNFNDLDGME